MQVRPTPQARQSRAVVRSRAAPTKGLNSRDMITQINNGFATRLDNWICRSDGLHVRPGWSEISKGCGPVRSLLGYPGQPVVGRSDDNWIQALLPNPGGLHLVATGASGAAPTHYDGVTWRDAAISGVDPTRLRGVIRHSRRLWFIEAETLTLWYLCLDGIGGPACPLYCNALCERGGSFVAMGTMTGDASDEGVGDLLCAVTGNGELVVYRGTSPDDADTWALQGVYDVPRPTGPHCFTRYGRDLLLLTVDGLLSIPALIGSAASEYKSRALTRHIGPELNPQLLECSKASIDPKGWCWSELNWDMMPAHWLRYPYATVNGAVLDSGATGVTMIDVGGTQYVRDPETKGWSRWTDLGARCWLEHDDGLYMGRDDGTIAKLEGGLDGGCPVRTLLVDSFAKFGSQRHKRFTRIRPHYLLAHPYKPRMEMLMDHREPPATWEAAHANSQHHFWHELNWDRMPMHWTKPVTARLQPWRSIAGQGHVGALMMAAQFHQVGGVFIGADYMFENGGML